MSGRMETEGKRPWPQRHARVIDLLRTARLALQGLGYELDTVVAVSLNAAGCRPKSTIRVVDPLEDSDELCGRPNLKFASPYATKDSPVMPCGAENSAEESDGQHTVTDDEDPLPVALPASRRSLHPAGDGDGDVPGPTAVVDATDARSRHARRAKKKPAWRGGTRRNRNASRRARSSGIAHPTSIRGRASSVRKLR